MSDRVHTQSIEEDVIDKPCDHAEPKDMKYDSGTSDNKRGVVHVFNNYKFNKLKNFEGGEKDSENLNKVFKAMNYKIKTWNNLTKVQTDQAFEDIQQTKGLSKDFCMLFFILSHGSGEFIFYTSDDKPINLFDKMIMFRNDQSSAMRYKPKLWFGDFCRGKDIQRGVGPFKQKDDNIRSEMFHGKAEALTCTRYIMSSNPGMISVYSKGSVFAQTICEMLGDDKYKRMELNDQWYSELTRRLRKKKCPSIVTQTRYPFPGQYFPDAKFSFMFDLKKLENRVTTGKLGAGIESRVEPE